MRLRVDFNLIATVLAIVALLEGLAIFVNAHQVTLHGSSYFDGFARGTISIAGVQLAILGGIALLALWLPREKIPNDHLRALTGLVPVLCGVAIVIEGLLISYFANPITILDLDMGVRRDFVAAFGVQLFFLGTGLISSWIFKERNNLGVVVSAIAFIAILSIGLWLASVAELVVWTGFNGFYGRTVFTAGALLMVMGLIGLSLNYLEGKAILGKSVFGMPIWFGGIVLLGAMIALGGLAGLSIANTVRFATQGGFSGTPVAMAMFGIFAIGMLTFIPRFLLDRGNTIVGQRALSVGFFLVVLLPFALLV